MTDEEKRKRAALVHSIVSSSPDANDNDDGFANFLTLLATPAVVSITTPLNKKNDTINNNKEDVKKDIDDNKNTTTTTTSTNSAEEEQRIKQFNKTLEQIMIRRESDDDKKNIKKQQPTLPEAFYKSYSMTLPKTLKGSSKKK